MLCLPHSTEPFEVAKTYSQLLQNIESLKRQAEERRRTEVKGVVDRIREAIKFYGLTAADLGLAGGSAGRAATPKAAAGGRAGAAPKFRDGSGNVWSGHARAGCARRPPPGAPWSNSRPPAPGPRPRRRPGGALPRGGARPPRAA